MQVVQSSVRAAGASEGELSEDGRGGAPLVVLLEEHVGGGEARLYGGLEAVQEALLLVAAALKAALGDGEHLARQVVDDAAAERRLQSEASHVEAHGLHLLEGEVLGERQRLGLRLLVVQE